MRGTPRSGCSCYLKVPRTPGQRSARAIRIDQCARQFDRPGFQPLFGQGYGCPCSWGCALMRTFQDRKPQSETLKKDTSTPRQADSDSFWSNDFCHSEGFGAWYAEQARPRATPRVRSLIQCPLGHPLGADFLWMKSISQLRNPGIMTRLSANTHKQWFQPWFHFVV